MKRVLLIFFILIFLPALTFSAKLPKCPHVSFLPNEKVSAQVVRIVDGDTLWLRLNKGVISRCASSALTHPRAAQTEGLESKPGTGALLSAK